MNSSASGWMVTRIRDRVIPIPIFFKIIKIFNYIEQINNKTSLVFLQGNIYLDETKTLVPNQKISSQADTLIAVKYRTMLNPANSGSYGIYAQLEL